VTDVDLDLAAEVVALTAALVDVPSVSGTEGPLADAVETALTAVPQLRVDRDGDAVVARTHLGRDRRVLLAGHLDTVPIAGNVPSRRDGDWLHGCGTTDMKGGVAVLLHLAATLTDPAYDVTFVCYDNEEVEATRNGLRRLAQQHRDWLDADFALLLEPTDGRVEAGCQGTLRVTVRVPGRRAHSARSWLGENAIHAAAPLLVRLVSYDPRTVVLDGCEYREGLNAVGIAGGVAGNVIPDECLVTVNFRFAPDRSETKAFDHVREVLAPYDCVLVDAVGGAPPGLGSAVAQDFVAAVGTPPVGKLGWTDVARFAALGIPAVNYGPGDPTRAHTVDERVAVASLVEAERVLRAYLSVPRR
jgi:succinyl-diaminopimelate desuccinylase